MGKYWWLEHDTELGRVPEHTHNALIAYLTKQYHPGGFLTAILANDLFSAVSRADPQNRVKMTCIAEFILNHFPTESYGNYEAVSGWVNGNEHSDQFIKDVMWEKLNEQHSL